MPESLDTRRKYGGRLDRSIPWETQQELDEIMTWRHISSRNAVMSYLIKMEMPKVRREQLKAAMAARTYPVTVSEGLDVWLLEESARNHTTPGEILERIVKDYYNGLMYRQIGKEKP